MRKLFFILLFLALPNIAWAVDNQACGATSTHCTLTINGTNGTIITAWETGANNTTQPTDNFTDTYHVLATAVGGGTGCFTTTNSFGVTVLLCWSYANNGSNTGALTVTGNANTNEIFARFLPSTDVINSGNPLDKQCTFNGLLPAAATSINTCSLQSTQTNDIWTYIAEQDVSGGCSFGTPTGANNGPSVTSKGALNCTLAAINYDSSGVIQPSGAPQTVTIQLATSNGAGGNQNFNAFLVTLKSGNVGTVKHKARVIKYTPHPDSIPAFRPELIFTILRRWQRPCEPIRFL